MPLPTAVVFSRAGCHLCECLIEELLPLVRDRWRLDIVDIDSDERLLQQYGDRVPVLEFDGRLLCQYTLDRQAVLAALQSARDGASHKG